MGLERRSAPVLSSNSNDISSSSNFKNSKGIVRKRRRFPVRFIGLVVVGTVLLLGFTVFRRPDDDFYISAEAGSAAAAAAAAASSAKKDAAKKSTSKAIGNDKDWTWFNGDLNKYYNSLEKQIHDRDPAKIASYAVHRWMGPTRSTEEHYELIDRAVAQHHPQRQQLQQQQKGSATSPLKIFDAGCGLGSALMFFESRRPDWNMIGHTISEEQYKFIESKLPKHTFKVNLRSFDQIDDDDVKDSKKHSFDVIYSIEALIHSMDVHKTMKEWAEHLAPGGIIVIIDDYVSDGTDKDGDEMQAFSKSWLANVLITPTEFEKLANGLGLTMVKNRDLLAEYDIVKRNYRNQKPNIKPIADRDHQGWMGSKWRQ